MSIAVYLMFRTATREHIVGLQSLELELGIAWGIEHFILFTVHGSCTNMAFLESRNGAQVSFGVQDSYTRHANRESTGDFRI